MPLAKDKVQHTLPDDEDEDDVGDECATAVERHKPHRAVHLGRQTAGETVR